MRICPYPSPMGDKKVKRFHFSEIIGRLIYASDRDIPSWDWQLGYGENPKGVPWHGGNLALALEARPSHCARLPRISRGVWTPASHVCLPAENPGTGVGTAASAQNGPLEVKSNAGICPYPSPRRQKGQTISLQ